MLGKRRIPNDAGFKKSDSILKIVFTALYRALNNVTEMHPWHLHGYSFFVVGMGDGVYDEGTDTAKYNLVNPIRRDTFTLLPNGWTAIRFRANNVGIWPLHCVIPPHLVMGMETLLVVSPDKLESPPPGSTSCGDTSLATDEDSKSTNLFSSSAEDTSNSNYADSTNGETDEETSDAVDDYDQYSSAAGHSITMCIIIGHALLPLLQFL